MAMAIGTVPNLAQLDLSTMSQQQAEAAAVNFELLGLTVLANPVRADSKDTIVKLQERSADLAAITDKQAIALHAASKVLRLSMVGVLLAMRKGCADQSAAKHPLLTLDYIAQTCAALQLHPIAVLNACGLPWQCPCGQARLTRSSAMHVAVMHMPVTIQRHIRFHVVLKLSQQKDLLYTLVWNILALFCPDQCKLTAQLASIISDIKTRASFVIDMPITPCACSGGIRTMMITGDYHHTAISVAKDVSMIHPLKPIMVLDAAPQETATAGQAAAAQPAAGSVMSSQDESSAQPMQQLPSGTVSQLDAHSQNRYQVVDLPSAQSQAPGGLDVSVQPVNSQPALSTVQQVQPDLPKLQSSSRFNHVTSSALAPTRAGSSFSGAAKRVAFGSESPSDPAIPYGDPTPDTLSTQAPACAAADACSLRFMVEDAQWESATALKALAEGQLQCAVTGDAFQLLLQLPYESALDVVLHNAAVYARMKPHQKGQLMDLLSVRGLYQLHGRNLRHIQVCSQAIPASIDLYCSVHLCCRTTHPMRESAGFPTSLQLRDYFS